jgi:fructose-1,6-bisphosphatase/inositol monophosphatase family enzyme
MMATQHQGMENCTHTTPTVACPNGAVAVVRRLGEFATKKRLVLMGMVPAGITLGYLFCLGCAAGFVICKLCGGAEAGIQGRVRSIIIPLRNYELHLHHWVLSLVAAS